MQFSYWDTWKGIAILAVIASHVSGTALSFPAQSFNWYFGITLFQFIDFGVPLFLALSGYFTVKSYIRSDSGIFKYWCERLTRIAPPYCFWTAVFILSKSPYEFLSISKLAKHIFFGTGIGIGYFVIVLIQFILITPLIMKIRKTSHHFFIMIVLTCGGMIINYVMRINYSDTTFATFPFYALPFIVWYPYYHFGIIIAQKEVTWASSFISRSSHLLALYFILISLCLTEAFILMSWGLDSLATSQIKISSLLASISLFLFAVAFQNDVEDVNIPKKYLAWLGRNSYPIYLMHILFIPRISSFVKRSSFIYEMQPIYITIVVLAVISACAIILMISKYLFSGTLQKIFIGNQETVGMERR